MTEQRRRDRHLDADAAGSPSRLLPGLGAVQGNVTVAIGSSDAQTSRGQLLTWAVLNLLLRCYGVLETVVVYCPDAPVAAELPCLTADNNPATLHQALANLAKAIAEPHGSGPNFELRPGMPQQLNGSGTATLVLGSQLAAMLAGAARSASDECTWLVTAGSWKLCIASPAALAGRCATSLPSLDQEGPVSAAAWLAAAIGCAEVFKTVGQLREGGGRAIKAFSINLWTLMGRDGFTALDTIDGPAQPPEIPAHYVVGAGAVAQAYLAVLATSDVVSEVLLLDHDLLTDTNLNRHVLAGWADLEQPKAHLARDRLARYPTRIIPVIDRWQNYLALPPIERPDRPQSLKVAEISGRYGLVISAVDRNNSRIAVASARPRTILGGSTNGLSVEVGRYLAESDWQCLACASPPEPEPTIEQAAKELAGKTPAELAAIASKRDLNLAALLDYLGRPRCGTLGEREVARFAAFSQPDWSVSFVSAASGALLAARTLVNAAASESRDIAEGDTLRLWLASAEIARTAHRRNPDCPICGLN
jgi:molybdopterin/thiamine biosynthesis adenylyltransferase